MGEGHRFVLSIIYILACLCFVRWIFGGDFDYVSPVFTIGFVCAVSVFVIYEGLKPKGDDKLW